jgi:hypothetical protein
MKMKAVLIGFVMAALVFAATLPANAQSFEEETDCEIDFLDLQPADLEKVPVNRRTSYFAPVHEGDFAIRKCTESETQQTQSLSCRKVITGWAPLVEFQTNSFARPCQMVSCDGTEFVDAENQMLEVRALNQDTVEVFLECQRRSK